MTEEGAEIHTESSMVTRMEQCFYNSAANAVELLMEFDSNLKKEEAIAMVVDKHTRKYREKLQQSAQEYHKKLTFNIRRTLIERGNKEKVSK